MPISIAIAGTTKHTVLCAEALRADAAYSIAWVLTPAPKPVGRKQVIQKNPLHRWAEAHNIPVIVLTAKIDETTKTAICALPRPDFVLVIDFGYLVPKWLLEWPTTAPLNIHPSDLPRWRGSSPGQFAVLYGDAQSAICLMQMSAGMDEGPIFYRMPFAVQPAWTQTEYYAESFALIAPQLPGLMQKIHSHTSVPTPQNSEPTTPAARKLTKADSFVPWEVVTAALAGKDLALEENTTPLMAAAQSAHPHLASLLASATRAFSPWPLLWTAVTTPKGTKRMQLLKSHAENTTLVLDEVKIEGKTAMSWKEAEKSLI